MRGNFEAYGAYDVGVCARTSFRFVLVLGLAIGAARADDPPKPTFSIPRLSSAPKIDELAGMAPEGAAAAMHKVEGFIQARPRDGEPATQKTEVFLGYDDKNLYLAWICFDAEPNKIRAHLTPREQAFADDFVEVTLDTFHDNRRGFIFWSNPLGVQAEGLWTEENDNPQWSWDTTWDSWGRTTSQGYVTLMSIPFKSLRFASADPKTWGIVLLRQIPRVDEWAYWPQVTTRIRGRLSQEGTMSGLERISPGRNIQLTPYVFADQGWLLDATALPEREIDAKPFYATAGLDAKFVIGDSVTVDATINPDFSQVESDEPQIAVNQRYELFFPEKRPFFLENADLFQLQAANLLFTRRIVDPSYGARVTGKKGKYAFGALLADDQSQADPATFGVASVRRDVLQQSSVGIFGTTREQGDAYNRVLGAEGNFRVGKGWAFNAAGFGSATRTETGEVLNGPLFQASASYNDRIMNGFLEYIDVDDDFRTETGFLRRSGVRSGFGEFEYSWRPEGKVLISYGPGISGNVTYDRDGQRLDDEVRSAFNIDLVGGTYFQLFIRRGHERLRPADLPGLTEALDFEKGRQGLFFGTEYFKKVIVNGNYRWGTEINYFAANGIPELAAETFFNLQLTIRPVDQLVLDTSVIYDRLNQQGTGAQIFRSAIARVKCNWQFNREWSLRLIVQGDDLQSDPSFVQTSAPHTRDVNTDVLLTWLKHPGTAVYVGYNTNASNLATYELDSPGSTRPGLVGDGRRLFVKLSYQFRL